MKTEYTECLEDRELNRTRSKPDLVDQRPRTARIPLCTIVMV